ncbi:VOC family protein [Streptomyces canus]|uniref:VOC family protein n=1 Tax=Streptomyces canus TaxID=58343 RepID=UPI003679D32E
MEIAPPDGGPGLSFQTEPLSAVEHALALGATVTDFQPQDDVRVLFDPAGHPFCLFVLTGPGA